MEMLLIRHGLPIHTVNPDGKPADPPLSEAGHEQARLVAEWLREEPIQRIYSSPLRRARETAFPLAQQLGLEIEIEARIREFDAEASEYIPLEELKRTDPERWREFIAGGYTSGLDFDAFAAEVVAGLQHLIDQNPGRRIAVFCHGGVINSWATYVLGIAPTLFLDAAYTSVSRFVAASTGQRSIASLNEAAHLRPIQLRPKSLGR
ncbi:MAG: histidine phosphatase family protein [Myxococcales bacterium]|nr:histidine phosphatase family protein [Myxococcales bacterium]